MKNVSIILVVFITAMFVTGCLKKDVVKIDEEKTTTTSTQTRNESNENDFEIDENGIITAYAGKDKDIVIPARIGGIPVTAIGPRVFEKRSLTSVIMPESVTSIGVGAFYENRLISIVIPGSVTSIGDEAFLNEESYKETFNDAQIESITIGNNVNLGYPPANLYLVSSFGGFDGLYSATGKKAGTYIYKNGQWRITGNGIIKENGFEIDGNGTIIAHDGLDTSIIIPTRIGGVSVTAIGYQVFRGKGLLSVTIPNSVTSIGEGAFSDNQLTSVTIPDSVTSIGGYAFFRNYLTNVTIPDSVTEISYRVFDNNQLKNIHIPDGVTSIGNRAFYNNQLTTVTIPNSVTFIDEGVFYNNQLTSITIGSNVELPDKLHDNYNPPFDNDWDNRFLNFYNSNGKKAGTYILSNGQWSIR